MVFQTVLQSVQRSQQTAGTLENCFMKTAVPADDVADMLIGKGRCLWARRETLAFR